METPIEVQLSRDAERPPPRRHEKAGSREEKKSWNREKKGRNIKNKKKISYKVLPKRKKIMLRASC